MKELIFTTENGQGSQGVGIKKTKGVRHVRH